MKIGNIGNFTNRMTLLEQKVGNTEWITFFLTHCWVEEGEGTNFHQHCTLSFFYIKKTKVHSVKKRKIHSHWSIISWNQFFSNFFSKNVYFTEKMFIFPNKSWSRFLALFHTVCIVIDGQQLLCKLISRNIFQERIKFFTSTPET